MHNIPRSQIVYNSSELWLIAQIINIQVDISMSITSYATLGCLSYKPFPKAQNRFGSLVKWTNFSLWITVIHLLNSHNRECPALADPSLNDTNYAVARTGRE